MEIIIPALIFLVLIVIVSNIRVVPQSYAIVIERLGAYYTTWNTGLHIKIPFLDRMLRKVSLKEQVVAKDAKLQEIGYKAYLEGMK